MYSQLSIDEMDAVKKGQKQLSSTLEVDAGLKSWHSSCTYVPDGTIGTIATLLGQIITN